MLMDRDTDLEEGRGGGQEALTLRLAGGAGSFLMKNLLFNTNDLICCFSLPSPGFSQVVRFVSPKPRYRFGQILLLQQERKRSQSDGESNLSPGPRSPMSLQYNGSVLNLAMIPWLLLMLSLNVRGNLLFLHRQARGGPGGFLRGWRGVIRDGGGGCELTLEP